jgi:hypothetical protein
MCCGHSATCSMAAGRWRREVSPALSLRSWDPRLAPGATSGRPGLEVSRVNESQRGDALLSGQFGCGSGVADQPSATELGSRSNELRYPCGGGPVKGPLLRQQVEPWPCLASMCQLPASSQCDQVDRECATTSTQAKEVWVKGSGEAQANDKDQGSNVTPMLSSSTKNTGWGSRSCQAAQHPLE